MQAEKYQVPSEGVAKSWKESPIFIDKIRAIGPCTHNALGEKEWSTTNLDTGEIRRGRGAVDRTLDHQENTYHVCSRDMAGGKVARKLDIHVCPTKLLQRHNVFGHGDLQSYLIESFDRITEKEGVKVNIGERAEWVAGRVPLTEVHVTGNFRCPRDLILPVIDALDRASKEGKHRNMQTCITLGMGPRRRSKHRALTIYDKLLELHEEWKGQKLGDFREWLLVYCQNLIRVELKLYSDGLKYRGLDRASSWQRGTAEKVFFEILGSFNLGASVQRIPKQDAVASLSRSARIAYYVWLAGHLLEDLYSKSTLHKHRHEILKVVDVDVASEERPVPESEIKLASILSRSNLLSVPDWVGDEFFWQPNAAGP